MKSRMALIAVFALGLIAADVQAQTPIRNKSRSGKSYVRRASCNGGGCSAGSASSGIVETPSCGAASGCEMASAGSCDDCCGGGVGLGSCGGGCGSGGCGAVASPAQRTDSLSLAALNFRAHVPAQLLDVTHVVARSSPSCFAACKDS